MELIEETAMKVGWRVWQARPPQPSLTVVVKATFEIPEEGVCRLADEQALPTGDLHHDDDPERSLRYASDLELLKPRAECLVVGSFHAPGGRPVPHSKAAFQIGAVGKQLAVFGDRAWGASGPGAPTPMTTMPLAWERAVGGPGVYENPVGAGLRAVQTESGAVTPMPNLEDPAQLWMSPGARPKPIGLGPVPRTWRSRIRFAGTYDEVWQQTRYPWFPEDMDWRFFNAAPEDQQIDGWWRGDEEIALRHLHPAHPTVRCRLPGLRPRAFLARAGESTLDPVGLRLDTLVVDADAGLLYALWRGVTEVKKEDLSDVTHLYVAEQAPGARTGDDAFQASYQAKLDALAAEAIAEEAEPAPTSSLEKQQAMLAAMVDPSAPGAKWAHLDQAMTVRGDDTALQEALREAMEQKRAAEGGIRSVFDDALKLGPRSEERELSPEEQLELEMQLALGDMLDPTEDPGRERVQAAARAGESLEGADLSGADLGGLDLVELDLRGAILARANLSGARIERCKLDGANLAEAELSMASFDGCSLTEADLTSVRAQRARFHHCDLSDAVVRESFVREARFGSCTLRRTELAQSDLADTHWMSCTLDEADLSGATLEQAVFRDSTLVDAWLEGGVKARRLRLDGCDATLLRASEGGDFQEASFKRARLDGARFGQANLRRASFNLATLSRADFSEASLLEAALVGCDLRHARFDGASMVRAALMKSNLMQARFEGANLTSADLRGASLYQAELFHARLDDARLDLADTEGTRLR